MSRASVCMATYNGETFLREQVESILRQLGSDDELVVQDDGSTDATLAILRDFHDPRIHVECNERNIGVIRTIERALRRAQGEFVILSDQDDVWLAGRLDRGIALLAEHDLAVVNCRIVDADLRPLNGDFFAAFDSGPGLLKNLYKNTFIGCCMSFRRSLLARALPFPQPIPMHDMWLGLVATVWGTVGFDREVLVLYRRHAGAVTPTATLRAARPWSRRLGDRVQLATAIAARALSRRAAGRE